MLKKVLALLLVLSGTFGGFHVFESDPVVVQASLASCTNDQSTSGTLRVVASGGQFRITPATNQTLIANLPANAQITYSNGVWMNGTVNIGGVNRSGGFEEVSFNKKTISLVSNR